MSSARLGSAPSPPAMGQARLPARRGLGCCVLVLLLLLGGSGSPGTPPPPRGPRPQEPGPEPEGGPWGRGRYEAVRSHLGTVGALSRQYWRYVACRLWQEGCQEEEKREGRKAAPIPSKPCPVLSRVLSLFLSSPAGLAGVPAVPVALPVLPQHCCPGHPSWAQPGASGPAGAELAVPPTAESLYPGETARTGLGRAPTPNVEKALSWNLSAHTAPVSRLELSSGGPGLPGDPLSLVLQLRQVLRDRRLQDNQQHHR